MQHAERLNLNFVRTSTLLWVHTFADYGYVSAGATTPLQTYLYVTKSRLKRRTKSRIFASVYTPFQEATAIISFF